MVSKHGSTLRLDGKCVLVMHACVSLTLAFNVLVALS